MSMLRDPAATDAPLPTPAPAAAAGQADRWTTVCQLRDILPDSGVQARVADREIAVFRVWDARGERLYALDDHDLLGAALELAHGLVGDKAGVPYVSSPVLRQRFDLRTGSSLDGATRQVPIYPVRCTGDRVEIRVA